MKFDHTRTVAGSAEGRKGDHMIEVKVGDVVVNKKSGVVYRVFSVQPPNVVNGIPLPGWVCYIGLRDGGAFGPSRGSEIEKFKRAFTQEAPCIPGCTRSGRHPGACPTEAK